MIRDPRSTPHHHTRELPSRRPPRLRAALSVVLLALGASAAQAATFVVNSTGDADDLVAPDGSCNTGGFVQIAPPSPALGPECTLRAAIREANATPTHDVIEFSHLLTTAGGAVTFTPTTPYPIVSAPVTIDGYSHPDYDATATNPTPIINLVGAGAPATSNGLHLFPGAGGSIIRGLAISEFGASGILLSNFLSTTGPSNVVIQGNHLGLNRGGLVRGNGLDGIRILRSDGNTVGTVCDFTNGCIGLGNLLVGNGRSGIRLEFGDDNSIAGNRVGTTPSGNATFIPFGGNTPNASHGIHVDGGSDDNSIGSVGRIYDAPSNSSTWDLSGNLVSGNLASGISIEGERNIAIANTVGMNLARTAALPNQAAGIFVAGSENSIGGADAIFGNWISGNVGPGISMPPSPLPSDVSIIANVIGLDGTRSMAIPNDSGIQSRGTGHVILGNTIAGNDGHGIWVSDFGTQILANMIGTNGTDDLGNAGSGIFVQDNAIIGLPGQGNVIGFNDIGIETNNSSHNLRILDNRIGVGPGGENFGNDNDGIFLDGGGHIIGGADAIALGHANVIGFNGGNGIYFDSPGLATVGSNYIGTDATNADLGNALAGIHVSEAFPSGQIGADPAAAPADVAAAGNIIANNGAGIVNEGADGLSIRGNLAWGNDAQAIDLGADGWTQNDPSDFDAGANALQNSPRFDGSQTYFEAATGDVHVRYLVDSLSSESTYPLTIDFYVHDPWLEPGDQARVYIGSDTYAVSDAGGYRAAVIQPLPGALQPNLHGFVFEGLRATATDAEGHTSELSIQTIPVPEPSFSWALGLGVLGLFGRTKREARRETNLTPAA